ncbi:SDR family oxidoreductase [soil metagenome]
MAVTRLDGRRIIITGGASGMGEGLVRAFPGLGADVVSLDMSEESGQRIADDSGATFIRVDVAEKESVDAAIGQAVESLGGLDVLVHAAGIAPSSPAETSSVDLWTTTLTVNTLGTMLTNQAAYAHMKHNGGGQIINFASGAGIVGLPNKSVYAMSKGAVVAWTRTAAQEWAKNGVTLNMIAPAIWTPMYDKTRSEMAPKVLAAHDAYLKTAIPLGGKLGDIDEDFVPVLAFYASEGAKFVTGQVVPVDGGTLMVR